jgi:hypothetical protein
LGDKSRDRHYLLIFSIDVQYSKNIRQQQSKITTSVACRKQNKKSPAGVNTIRKEIGIYTNRTQIVKKSDFVEHKKRRT